MCLAQEADPPAAPARPDPRGIRVLIAACVAIGVLLWMAHGMGVTGRGCGNEPAARQQLAIFRNALAMYEIDNESVPTTAEGLDALVRRPASQPPRWRRYLECDRIPADPWGRPYVYRATGRNTFELGCLGRDGIEGTEDDLD